MWSLRLCYCWVMAEKCNTMCILLWALVIDFKKIVKIWGNYPLTIILSTPESDSLKDKPMDQWRNHKSIDIDIWRYNRDCDSETIAIYRKINWIIQESITYHVVQQTKRLPTRDRLKLNIKNQSKYVWMDLRWDRCD